MASSSVTRPLQRPPCRRQVCHRQEGYVLLTLLLVVALMGIFALAVFTPIKFGLQRDRETELIHRGVQYSRAIRNYYKKFGRYPTRLEDLDNTNNLRYLRKHYKDPVTGKDFKLLHYGDPDLAMAGSIGGGGIAGANTVGQMNASASSGSAFGSGPGGSAFGQSSSFGGNSNSAFGGNSSSGFGGSSSGGFGGSSGGGFGSGFSSSSSSGTSNSGASSSSGTSITGTSTTGSTQTGTSGSQDSSSTQSGSSSSSGQGSNQVFGGGPIVGVASTSKDATIREFNKKKKYNQWQFVYDPTTDRGGLILTPNQPQLQLAGNPMGPNGQPGNANSNGSSFGQSSGFGNNPNPMGGSTAPAQPPSSSPQQQ
jgi:type II secretory pathway pseudopilin PulG